MCRKIMEHKIKMRISLIILVFILHMLPFSHSKSIVKHLPGFSGYLPFTLETGYVGVGEEEQVQLFYYFVESQRNPHKDPLLLYLTGGPGTSAFLPFFYQIGPLKFEYTNASRSDVKLEVNPFSWTKTASIIFIDLPVDTGFSYAKRLESSKKNSIERGVRPELKIKGFLIVNPHTDKFIDFNARTEFAHRAGLIEDELYEPAKEHCGGKYIYVDPNNTLCLDSLRPIKECLDRVNVNYILDPLCNRQDPNQTCRESIYSYSGIWANKKSVRKALNIREGTVDKFQISNANISSLFGRPDTIYYSHDIFSSLAYYKKLATKKCHALIIKYEKTYSEAKFSLKYATIKGAGHAIALYKPEESMVVVETWLASHTDSLKP
ncbi:hypothetical protein M8C21_033968 [Ambrosia artemisiifolia]|uniref:Peptidase S10, serine carboxypeptidase, Alpha/Beta hydrolase fold protein n=1 Tax=Ambrosia artemisiifolia TaxID=4212 RepID=A0AAD5CJZ9_AMBAR|nr:hypothetical protein M8C21_033968 [Ambrosia artemisiifolia]